MLEVAVILLLAVATYATRIGGYHLVQRLQPSPFVEAFMTAMPGAIFAALVAPMVLAAGPIGWASAGTGFSSPCAGSGTSFWRWRPQWRSIWRLS